MKRRTFLGAAALAAFAPSWIRRAFGDASFGGERKPPVPPHRYREALERARKAGRPLLVLVIPDEDSDKWDRGRAFGEWINHGTDAQLAPLALVEVACLGLGEVGRVYDGPSDPLMLLVDPSERRPMHIMASALPRYTPRGRVITINADGTRGPEPPSDDSVFTQRVAMLSRLLAEAVEIGPLDEARARALAQAARKRLRDRPPANAHWATSSGCGTTVEPTPEEIEAEERKRREEAARGVLSMHSVVSVGCGMGHVPDKSRRFLYWLARNEDG
jgi:hypothetical protein